ncbi:MAG: hypothetical protein KAU06_01325 [Candidatus Marinimicrobia bacterium]|nr:hypothetical protein [Candidatus Neomarinimicrobiota bacterium]
MNFEELSDRFLDYIVFAPIEDSFGKVSLWGYLRRRRPLGHFEITATPTDFNMNNSDWKSKPQRGFSNFCKN